MKYKHCFLLLVLFELLACNPKIENQVKIIRQKEIENVSSASGLEKIENHYWIASDNSSFLYQLDSNFTVIEKHKILCNKEEIIAKKDKRDFEAMFSYGEQNELLFLLGSGSKENRKTGLIYNAKLKHLVNELQIEDFYELIKSSANLNDDQLNIEAATILNDYLYLFNRKKNKVIRMLLNDFFALVHHQISDFNIEVASFQLPEINGIEAGFSGATTDEKFKRIVFTASVEDTDNTYDDGEVLGSLIGVIDEQSFKTNKIKSYELIANNNEILNVKVESLAVLNSEEDKISCVLVTDSDGGASEYIEVLYNCSKIK